MSATALRISLCAQQLTDAYGLDGFTMDDLAAAAEVSRRTVFNYFPSKIDAVLGVRPELDCDLVATFRAGGPEGDLVEDLRTLILPMFTDQVAERAIAERMRRVLIANARLLGSCHEHYQAISSQVVEHIAAREGPSFSSLRARVAVTVLAAVLEAALDEFLLDPLDRPITTHVEESLKTARSLLGR